MSKLEKYKEEIKSSPAKPQNAKAKKVKVKNQQTLTGDPGRQTLPIHSSEGANFLSSVLQATIFFNYFEHVAYRTYQGGRSDLKILKLKTAHPFFHKSCICADWFARVLAFLALFALATWSAYKVISK